MNLRRIITGLFILFHMLSFTSGKASDSESHKEHSQKQSSGTEKELKTTNKKLLKYIEGDVQVIGEVFSKNGVNLLVIQKIKKG